MSLPEIDAAEEGVSHPRPEDVRGVLRGEIWGFETGKGVPQERCARLAGGGNGGKGGEVDW